MATEAAAGEPKIYLQIYIDKKMNRVLFAEAKKDFVDFIFHILSLPLVAVQRILTKTSTILGSIRNIQNGFEKLDDKYFETNCVLDLKAPYLDKKTTLLLPGASCSSRRQFYQCSKYQSVHVDTQCLHGHLNSCSKQINLQGDDLDMAVVRGSEKGYVMEFAKFMVMDNLFVQPAVPANVFSVMNEQSINDVRLVEKRAVTFSTPQAIKLLKAALGSTSSSTVLTDVFLRDAVKAEN